jgi:hypothetical protein
MLLAHLRNLLKLVIKGTVLRDFRELPEKFDLNFTFSCIARRGGEHLFVKTPCCAGGSQLSTMQYSGELKLSAVRHCEESI